MNSSPDKYKQLQRDWKVDASRKSSKEKEQCKQSSTDGNAWKSLREIMKSSRRNKSQTSLDFEKSNQIRLQDVNREPGCMSKRTIT